MSAEKNMGRFSANFFVHNFRSEEQKTWKSLQISGFFLPLAMQLFDMDLAHFSTANLETKILHERGKE